MFIQITYETIGTVQLTFLRLLHEEVRQNFTYTCINSIAWFNFKTGNYDQALKFQTDNDQILSANSSIKPLVHYDGCKVIQLFSNQILVFT